MTSSADSFSNPADDPISHYYLHPSDNPGALIVSDIFNGDNYTSWSRSISMALSVKNKLGFIDGSLKSLDPLSGTTYNCWVRANDLVLSWLLNSINKDIRQSLLYISSAYEVWSELKTRYVRIDGPRVYHLEKCLSSISQGSQSLTMYYNSFKGIWKEYTSYRPLPKCSCGKLSSYTCEILKNISDTQQSDVVMKFLIGLNESYSVLRSQLLLTSPLPSLARVYALMLQEESQRDLQNYSFQESSAMTARQPHGKFSRPPAWRDKKKPKCTHCGYFNHTADNCFQLIGYHPGWKGSKGLRMMADISVAHAVSLGQSADDEGPSSSFNRDLFNNS